MLGSFNVISGNVHGGIELEGLGSNLVAGNLIGTDITGIVALGNGGDGVVVSGAGSNTIGGTASGAGNLISANSGAGVSISAGGSGGNGVFGNVIGTDIGESLALGNTGSGIVISGAHGNSIGSAAGSGGNRIAGNQKDGLDILEGSFANIVVANTIGGTSGESASAVIGNAGQGILIQDAADNTIGTAPTQLTPLGTPAQLGPGANQVVGNGGDGIFVSITGISDGSDVIIGNLVARNSHNGIHVHGDISGDQGMPQISDNFIGTTLDGTSTYDVEADDQPQGNGLSGILLESTTWELNPPEVVAETISGNVISNNGLSGVTVQGVDSLPATTHVLIEDNLIGTDTTGENISTASSANSTLPFGNVLDGIQLDDVSGVTIGGPVSAGSVSLALADSGGNLIAGNVGQGIELNDASSNTIGGNLIGVVLSANGQQVEAVDTHGDNAGNLTDGIFLLNSVGDVIQGNLVSNNRGYGLHAVDDLLPRGTAAIDLLIAGNFIGTNNDGSSVLGLGNGADGVFLDTVGQVTVGGAAGLGNVIAGNLADGVDVLQSSAVLIAGNAIGTDAQGFSIPGNPTSDLGNASDGIFINESSQVTVGGITTGAGNTISGNHASGVFISGTVAVSGGGTSSSQNVIQGNRIGIGQGSQGQITAVPNAVAGIILSNADSNTIGGSSPGDANVISGNSRSTASSWSTTP